MSPDSDQKADKTPNTISNHITDFITKSNTFTFHHKQHQALTATQPLSFVHSFISIHTLLLDGQVRVGADHIGVDMVTDNMLVPPRVQRGAGKVVHRQLTDELPQPRAVGQRRVRAIVLVKFGNQEFKG